MHISHRREYAADAHAVAVLGSSKEYIEVLGRHSSATTKQETWFHPSSQWRIRALQLGCPVLRPSKFWFIFWSLYILNGVWQNALLSELDPDLPFLSVWQGLVSFEAAKGGSMCLLGCIGLLIELAKLMGCSKSDHTTLAH